MDNPENGGSETDTKQAVSIEYENLDIPPAYVEAAQGMPSPKGVLQVSFFSERIKCKDRLTTNTVQRNHEDGRISVDIASLPDPFGTDSGLITIIRRVEANLILTPEVIESLIPWLQQQLERLRMKDTQG